MPYIPQHEREVLDSHIEALADAVKERAAERNGDFEGMLNYAVTRLVLSIIPERRYKFIAAVIGVLENVKEEFYRRFAAPYEDEQREKAGDVY
jgi:hypothetical protein